MSTAQPLRWGVGGFAHPRYTVSHPFISVAPTAHGRQAKVLKGKPRSRCRCINPIPGVANFYVHLVKIPDGIIILRVAQPGHYLLCPEESESESDLKINFLI